MSDCDNSELDERLQELNSWQIEQHKKLKIFQEAQRKLLDSEHEKILSSLRMQNYNQRHAINEKDPLPISVPAMESDSETQNKTLNQNTIFNYDSDAIKLKDPMINLRSISRYSQQEKSDELLDNSNGNYEEGERTKPRPFLRRGEGLARFRMTVDDFKTPPNIYKEKRIKTYLNQKPEFNRRKPQPRSLKSVNDGIKKKPLNACGKSKAVPVNIYVSDNKNKNISPTVRSTCDVKVNRYPHCFKNKEFPVTKAPVRTLTLKPVLPSNCTRGLSDRARTSNPSDKATEKMAIEREMKKDEKELKMFEMLEGKIDEGSLSPNSSLVARFMEESLCSTPSKLNGDGENDIAYSYMESLRALQSRYLTPEQIESIKERDDELLSEEIRSLNMKSDDKISDSPISSLAGSDTIGEAKIDENRESEFDGLELLCKSDDDGKDCVGMLAEETPREVIPLIPHSAKASQTLLQEYIENFKKLKNELHQGCRSDNEEIKEAKNSLDDINDQVLSQREIAIKLQRKALQDNVKTLLNWEGPSRKRQPKKVVKKVKGKVEKARKDEKNAGDKIILNNGLVKERMAELEKEIEIFKRENKTLSQMQRECETEKARLEKERKEFEKYMEQEKEKFEAKMIEEQKKLQRDKNVFDKYCKQVRNQPNKKEREEITNLKKELEKLSESIATKESRWGASQARLRNQIKSLEKENNELKSEIEKLRKQNSKKVTFESEKNLNTKIIHAINSELGKLKPHLTKSGTAKPKYQSQTARVDSNLQRKPMRRIRSVPDLKNHSVKEDDLVEKLELSMPEPNKTENKLTYIVKEMTKSETSRSSRGSNSDLDKSADSTGKAEVPHRKGSSTTNCNVDPEDCADENKKKSSKSSSRDLMEAVLYETFFDAGDHNKTNGTITEIKKRLEKLNLLHHTDAFNGGGDNVSKSPVLCSSEESCESDEEDTPNFADSGLHHIKRCEDQSKYLRETQTCLSHHSLTKVDSDGVREKTYEDGRKEIFYPNGNIKKISADKRIVKMLYYNGDLKETDVADGSEKYFYAETKTWHTTYRDGLEVLEFPNGQTERRHPDGSTEILFPNGCIRYCDPSGKDEWRFLDGTVIKTDKNGHKILFLPNGQKEIHTDEYKRREYPDGTVKLLYADGTQETRYATGRVRLKDKDGNLIMDSGGIR